MTAGNYRMTLPLTDGADAVQIFNEPAPVKYYRDGFIAFLILFILILIATCVMCQFAIAARIEAEKANQN